MNPPPPKTEIERLEQNLKICRASVQNATRNHTEALNKARDAEIHRHGTLGEYFKASEALRFAVEAAKPYE